MSSFTNEPVVKHQSSYRLVSKQLHVQSIDIKDFNLPLREGVLDSAIDMARLDLYTKKYLMGR